MLLECLNDKENLLKDFSAGVNCPGSMQGKKLPHLVPPPSSTGTELSPASTELTDSAMIYFIRSRSQGEI